MTILTNTNRALSLASTSGHDEPSSGGTIPLTRSLREDVVAARAGGAQAVEHDRGEGRGPTLSTASRDSGASS